MAQTLGPTSEESSPSGSDAIGRVVHCLRNIGLGIVDEDEEEEEEEEEEEDSSLLAPLNENERLENLPNWTWTRPDLLAGLAQTPLPWERGRGNDIMEEEDKEERRNRVKASTLAELTIKDEELRQLRRLGMTLRDRINISKAGVSREVIEKIHDGWRRSELVRLKFNETLT